MNNYFCQESAGKSNIKLVINQYHIEVMNVENSKELLNLPKADWSIERLYTEGFPGLAQGLACYLQSLKNN